MVYLMSKLMKIPGHFNDTAAFVHFFLCRQPNYDDDELIIALLVQNAHKEMHTIIHYSFSCELIMESLVCFMENV